MRQAYKLGLTVRNVAPIVRELRAQPGFEDKTNAELGVEVLKRVVAQNPKPFEAPGIDWDAILEFIVTVLIPLILMLLDLFTLEMILRHAA